MLDVNEAVNSAVIDLGIDPGSLDGSDLEATPENKEVESIAEGEEIVASEETEDNEENTEKPEDVAEEVKTQEVQVIDPKLNVKEYQEIEAAKQSLEVERKAFTEQKALMEKEVQTYQGKIADFDQLDGYLASMANNDPDLFELVKEGLQGYLKEENNPTVMKLKNEQAALKKQLDTFLGNASDQVTLMKLDTEKNQLKSGHGKEAEEAGIKVDWDLLDKEWAKYPPHTSLEKVFFAEYGSNILKAQVSKAKLEIATKKNAARPAVATSGNLNRSNTPTKEVIPKDAFGAVNYYARQLLGKQA